MAGTSGQTTDDLINRLAKAPYAYDFFRAVRLLQSLRLDCPRLGYSQSPQQDPLRFAQKPDLAFATSTLKKVEVRPNLSPGDAGNGEEGMPRVSGSSVASSVIPRLWVNFMGLLGPNGPLPLHLTEYARERELHFHDPTFTAFLNLFHHRLISLFFRAWADNQKALDLDRSDDQRFATFLGSFFGIGMESLRHRDSVPDNAKLYYSGRLANQTRPAEGLAALLEDFFGVPAQIETFVGRWMHLPKDSCCRLGESPHSGQLGMNAIVGSRFWECQLNFRLKLGPMSLADYERILPSGSSYRRLRDWVLNYAGEQYFWDVQLVLAREEVPPICLGKYGQLGWTTWLKTEPFTKDAEDLVLIPPGN